jgi:proteic killer suppression protein
MIQNFRHKGLKLLYQKDDPRKVPPERADQLRAVLSVLDVATSSASIRFPSLHELHGDLTGHWAIAITANWRVTFRLENGHVYDVDYQDYH